MRRLTLLLGAFLLALFALQFGTGDASHGTSSAVQLRDGIVLALLAAGMAAWAAAPWPVKWNQTTWSTVARALVGSGIVTILVALALRIAPIYFLPNLSAAVWVMGMLAAFAGILMPPVIVRFAPPLHTWAKGRDGALVRKSVSVDGELPGLLQAGRGWWIVFTLLLLLGAGIRIWSVLGMAPVCVSSATYDECSALLQLAPDAAQLAEHSVLVIPLARGLLAAGGWLGAWFAEPLWALRWASLVAGILCLPALALALRPLAMPAGILLGSALFALHPLFVTLTNQPLAETALWLFLAVAGSASALRTQNPRGWALAGLTLGMLAHVQAAWTVAWLLWLLICVLLLVVRQPARAAIAPIALLLAGAIAGSALSSATAAEMSVVFAQGTDASWARLSDWYASAPAGTMWVLALASVGLGASVRMQRVGILLLAAAAGTAWVASRLVGGQGQLLLVFVALFAAIALDQLVRSAQRAWAFTASPANWLVAALVLVVGGAGWNLYEHNKAEAAIAIPVDDQVALATIELIQSARSDPALDEATWLLSPTLFTHGSVRSAAAQEFSAGRLLPFSAVGDLPYAASAPGGLVYILPASDQLTLETLRAVYPEGRTLPLASAANADAIRVWRVDPAVLFDSTGLAQFVYEGSEFGSADEAALSLGVGPLAFAWDANPPRELPFSVEWSGSLLVRTQGEHLFAVEAPEGATFSMTLDDRLILDTSLGLTERSESLPEGAHRLVMRYSSGENAGALLIAWQPPGDALAPIPREALYNPAIPDMGLLGTYTAGSAWDGALIAQRKDLQIIPDNTLTLPWGVVWQGYLAAPRAGEYLIGAVTNGTLFVDVDGRRLITHLPDVLESVTPPAEGTIYLEQAWIPVTIRFAPDASKSQVAPELRLYWQPPGGEPGPLYATFLASAVDQGEVTRSLPELASPDARLGDDDFALSADNSLWSPQVRIPPSSLELLPFENEARWALCGAGSGELDSPRGIAWDASSDLIYVADAGNARVVELNAETGETAILSIPDLEEPVDVALTPEGKVLVLDTIAPKLVSYDPETGRSEVIALEEGFYRPRGVAVDGGGVIYLADTGGARIVALAPDGGFLTAFGGAETRLGKGQPAAVAATTRALWAIAAEDGRLWQLNALGSLTAIQPTDTINGPHIATFRNAASGSGQARAAVQADETSTGTPLLETLFVSDPARRMVIWFAAFGQPLGALADEGAFDLPTGVAVIVRGDETLLAVADTARCEVSTWRAVTRNLNDLLP